jgi:hypothetical protein
MKKGSSKPQAGDVLVFLSLHHDQPHLIRRLTGEGWDAAPFTSTEQPSAATVEAAIAQGAKIACHTGAALWVTDDEFGYRCLVDFGAPDTPA